MPPPEAKDLPHSFDADGARRIVNVVRRVEAMPGNLRRELPPNPPLIPQAIWLAQSSAYQANNTSASNWSIFAGTTPGSETATQLTGLKAYVRKGLVYANVMYYLFEIGGILEVLDPTLSGIGKSNTAIGKGTGAANNVDIYAGTLGSETTISQTLTAWNRYAAVATGKWVRWAWNDDSKGFELVAAEC